MSQWSSSSTEAWEETNSNFPPLTWASSVFEADKLSALQSITAPAAATSAPNVPSMSLAAKRRDESVPELPGLQQVSQRRKSGTGSAYLLVLNPFSSPLLPLPQVNTLPGQDIADMTGSTLEPNATITRPGLSFKEALLSHGQLPLLKPAPPRF